MSFLKYVRTKTKCACSMDDGLSSISVRSRERVIVYDNEGNIPFQRVNAIRVSQQADFESYNLPGQLD